MCAVSHEITTRIVSIARAMHRPRWEPRTAAVTSAALAVAAVAGCIRLPAPAVQQDLTTGEKLRSIDAIARDPAAFVEHERPMRVADTGRELDGDAARAARIAQVSAWCSMTRERLVAGPVALEATVHAPAGTTPEGYGVFNPGLFSPVDRELADLHRARDAGVLAAAECAELEAIVRSQARRPIVRRESENAPVAVEVRISCLDWAFYDWSTRDRRPAWWWMANRVRMMDATDRRGAPPCRSFEEPGIPAPNPFSVPAAFRIRADGGAGR
jgi:hypothetical protein